MTPSSPPSEYAIKVLEQARVSPPPGSVPERVIPFTFLDTLYLAAGQVERLFYYDFPNSTAHFVDHCLPTLKSSLSLALQHFFPLAGRLRASPDSDHKFELYYTDGDSVSLVVADSGGDFGDVSCRHAHEYSKLRPLIPVLAVSDEMSALMALQVTVFPNRGLCIGVTISHGACDGTGFINFVKSWAATYASGSPEAVVVSPPPVYDRSMIVDPGQLGSVFYEFINKGKELSSQMNRSWTAAAAQGDEYFSATFTLRKGDVGKLKQQILAGAGEGKAPFYCSAFVISCAYAWVCMIKSRGWLADRTACAAFAVDCRARLSQPVPEGYFGNCLGICFVEEKKVGDLLGEDGVRAAAEAIGTAIDGLKGGALRGAEEWPERMFSMWMSRPLSVAGSPKFGAYGADFGWGKPVKVEVTSIKGTGAISLTESRNGDGGVEIGLVLPKLEMDEFAEQFAAGLQLPDPEGEEGL